MVCPFPSPLFSINKANRTIGYFKAPGAPAKEGGRNTPHMTLGREEKVSAVLDKVAQRHKVPLTSVALAYVLQKVSIPSSFQ